MNWSHIPPVWQECFEESWKSFQQGSRPIGAVVTDKDGNIIARGQSSAFAALKDSVISNNELAHAELNALLRLDNRVHSIRNTYTLYSTMEPCPLCFGAFYMSGLRHLKFAAKDKWAGSTNLKDTTPYMSFKPIKVDGPYPELEQLSIVLNIYFEHMIRPEKSSPGALKMAEDYPEAASLAAAWSNERRLEGRLQMNISDVFSMVLDELNEL